MSPQNFSKEKRMLLKTHTQFDGYDLDSNEQEDTSNQLVRFRSFESGNSLVTYAAIEALCSLLIKDESKRKAYFSAICRKLKEFKLLDRDSVFDSLGVSKEKIFQIFQIFRMFMRQMTAEDLSNIHVHNDELVLSSSWESTLFIPSYYKNNFLEIEEIAEGGFGIVCKARHKLDNIMYAVKKIHFKYKNDLYFKRVIREAQSFAALKHENIVNYNSAWIENCISKDAIESSSSSNSHSGDMVTENEDENFHRNSSQYLSKTSSESLETCGINSNLSSYNFTNDITCVNTSKNTMLTSSVTNTTFNKNSRGQNANVSINQSFEEESYMFSKSNYCSNRVFINSSNKSSVSVHVYDENLEDSQEFQCTEDEDLSEDHSFNVTKRRHSSGATCSAADDSTSCINAAESLLNSRTNNRVHSLELPKSRELVPLARNVSWDICHLNLRATLYIQMELCDKNLRQLLDERAANYNEDDPVRIKGFALNIFCQVLKGVEYIHSKSIIHRDLKPNNIFLCNTGEVKIGDFGLATMCNRTEEVSCCPPSYCHSGVHGTYPYAAPEQKTTKKYDAKVDIYSLGIILVELLVPCTTSMEFYKTVQAILQGDFPEKYRKNWPELVILIKKLTSNDHKERPSAKEVLSLVTCEDSQVNKCSIMKSAYFKNDICLCSEELLKAREIINQYETKIDEMESEYEAKMDQMKSEYETKMDQMKSEYETRINVMKHQQKEIAKALQLLEQKLLNIT